LKKSLCGKKVNAKTTPDEEVPKWQRSPIVANEKKKKNNKNKNNDFTGAWASTCVAPPPSLQECMIFALAMITKNKITNNNNTGVHFDWTTLPVHHDEYPEATIPEAHDDTLYNNNDTTLRFYRSALDQRVRTPIPSLQECMTDDNVCTHNEFFQECIAPLPILFFQECIANGMLHSPHFGVEARGQHHHHCFHLFLY